MKRGIRRARKRGQLLVVWMCGVIIALSAAGWVLTRFYQVLGCDPSGHIWFQVIRGQVVLGYSGVTWHPRPDEKFLSPAIQLPWDWFPSVGFGINPNNFTLYVPLWLCAFLSATVALAILRPWRLYVGVGCCLGCGYDRRGLPDDAKCPECGTVLTK
jgi:hypothetical protein